MDEAAVNAAGITPLRPMMARIQAIADRADWAAEAGRLFRQGVDRAVQRLCRTATSAIPTR